MSRSAAITLCGEAAQPGESGGVVVRRELEVLGRRVGLAAAPPRDSLPLDALAPLGWQVCDRLVRLAVEDASSRGLAVSCHKGCWTCCDMCIVPLSAPEAMLLGADIESLPPPAKSRADNYFQQMAAALAHQAADVAAECGHAMQQRTTWTVDEDWWLLHHRACPMLDCGACVLYDRRPTACREFMATTPPQSCREHVAKNVSAGVSVGFALAEAAGILEGLPPALVPLPTLRTWRRDNHARAAARYPAPVMVETFLDALGAQARRQAGA